MSRVLVAASLLVALAAVAPARAALFTITNLDGAGEGFNDATPATPVGGNTGTTVGQQRLNALQYGADIWGSILASNVTIEVEATFDALPCTASSAVLGQAGPVNVFRDFTGAPVANTYYPGPLANKLAGTDLAPGNADIDAAFNLAIDDGSCSFPCAWYYGLDGNPPGCDVDFIAVALHELGHGLGFLTLVDGASGAKLNGRDDAFMRFLEDHSTGKLYPDMTDAERQAAAVNNGNLHWVGSNVVGATGSKTGGVGPMGHAHMYAPTTLKPGSSVSHWDVTMTPDEVLEPSYTGPTQDPGLAIDAFVDIGWMLLNCGDGVIDLGEGCDDGNTLSGDGCSSSCKVEPCHTCTGAPSVCSPVTNGTPCNDGVFCNGADSCTGGSCTAHAGNPCPGPDGDADCSETCDETANSCTAPDPEGSPCSDGEACTSNDVCTAGTCVGTLDPLPCGLNPFLCYKVKTTKGTTPFTAIAGVSLADQFDTVVFDATKVRKLCTPADKNGEGFADTATHVKGYQLKAESGQPKHQKRTNLKIIAQLAGDLHVDTVKPDFLLVPSAKDPSTDPPAPSFGSHDVDHYECYKVKVTSGTPKFLPTQATLADQFTTTKLFDVKKVKHLCTPADRNGSGRKHPLIHFVCYQVKPASGEPKHTQQLGLHVNNLFSGIERLDTKKEEELCVPALKILPAP